MNKLGAGHFFAFLAYLQWGFFPLFFAEIKSLSPYQLTSVRTILCLFTLLILSLSHKSIRLSPKIFVHLFKNYKIFLMIMASSFLLAINYIVFIYLIQDKNTLAIGIGYFLSPVYKAMIGLFLLKEKITKLKITSLLLMSLTFGLLIQISMELFFLTFILGFSFSLYGLIKKFSPLSTFESLAQELFILTIFAVIYLMLDQSFSFHQHILNNTNWETSFILLSGLVTLSPLLFFNMATKKIEFYFLALWHYLAPALQSLMAIVYFSEELTQTHLILFLIMFLAILPNIYPALKKIISPTPA